MTLVAVAYDHRKGCIDCIADSRLSSGDSIVTDVGPKVLPLHIHAMKFYSEENKDDLTRYKHTIGFAYAGSMLSAMSTYGWLAGTLNQLLPRHEDDAGLPVDIQAIAQYCAKVATDTVTDAASRRAGATSDTSAMLFFEAYIFGYCIREKRFRCFHIFPNPAGEALHYQHIEVDLISESSNSMKFHAIGTGAYELVKQAMATQGRSIFEGVKSVIDDTDRQDVGGGMQIATAFDSFFTLTSVLEGNGSETKQYWLGRDVTDERVDGHLMFITGMRFKKND